MPSCIAHHYLYLANSYVTGMRIMYNPIEYIGWASGFIYIVLSFNYQLNYIVHNVYTECKIELEKHLKNRQIAH